MNRYEPLSQRAQRLADAMGANVRRTLPRAERVLDLGGKRLRFGLRDAGTFVRRHPLMLAATVAGAGVLWYALRQRADRVQRGAEGERTEGLARRIEARRNARRAERASRLHRVREARPLA